MARKKVSVETPSVPAVATAPVFPAARSDLDASELSDLARSFWAKSGNADNWLSVVQHLMDAADVAGHLFDEYVSEHHRRLMASVWDGDQAKARASFVFLAGVHDVGKVSPQFACQRQDLAELIRHQGLVVMRKKDYAERAFLPHGLVSQFALQEVVAAGGGGPGVRPPVGDPRWYPSWTLSGFRCRACRASAVQVSRRIRDGRAAVGAGAR